MLIKTIRCRHADFGPHASGPSRLNERTQHLLKFLVERYIRDGQPVGSRTLSRDAGLI